MWVQDYRCRIGMGVLFKRYRHMSTDGNGPSTTKIRLEPMYSSVPVDVGSLSTSSGTVYYGLVFT